MQNPLSQAKSMRSRLVDIVLSLLAIAGAICLVLVILGLTMNVSIMMFRTGSMEPTISTGSIALVREIPATEMAEGDVVTVDRGEDVLPVTHRVTDITDTDLRSGAVTFIMRGDANDVDDPAPYTTDTVRRAFFAVPGVAPVIQWFQNPLVLGGLTLGTSALVVWAFWPRDNEAPTRKRGAHSAQAIALPVILVLAAPLLASSQTTTTTDVYGDYLRLRSTGDTEQMSNMAPGDSATWVVDIWADTPEPGEIDLELSATGELAEQPDALTTEIVLCAPHPTEITACASGSEAETSHVDTAQLSASSAPFAVGTMTSEDTRRVLVTATLSDSAAVQGTTAVFRLTATGEHEQISVTPDLDSSNISPAPDDPDSDLASTGLSGTLWLIVIAITLIIVGLIITAARARKKPRDEEGDLP